MRGTIRQRGSSWEIRAYLGVDPITGTKRYTSRTVKGSRREAERRLAELVAAADQAGGPTADRTVGQLLEAWFEHNRADWSPKSVLEIRRLLDGRLLPRWGDVPLRKLKPADLDRWYRQLRDSGGRDGTGLAPASVRKNHVALHAACALAVKWGWMATNPVSRTSPPRVPKADVRPPSPAELARLLARAETDPRLQAFVYLAAAVGARRSELCALRWRDVDLDVGRVTIARGIVVGPTGLIEKDTKTHASRSVAIDTRTRDLLVRHRAAAEALAAAVDTTLTEDAFVFSGDVASRTPLQPDSLSRIFRSLCVACGVEGVRLHDLRHYVATQLLTLGVDVRTVAGRLGHRNAATTLNVYSHFVPEADRDASERLAAALEAAAQPSSGSTPPRR